MLTFLSVVVLQQSESTSVRKSLYKGSSLSYKNHMTSNKPTNFMETITVTFTFTFSCINPDLILENVLTTTQIQKDCRKQVNFPEVTWFLKVKLEDLCYRESVTRVCLHFSAERQQRYDGRVSGSCR